MAEFCSPQRFLAGDRDVIRNATLTPSSVLPVTDMVKPFPTARDGSGRVKISGTYTGAERATYDFEILDDEVEDPVVSKPRFEGVGSGELEDIETTLPAQEVTVALNESGLPLLYAAIDFEGATIKARAGGVTGNAIYFVVDQSPLTFTPQSYSLLNDLSAGAGGSGSPMTGAEFDFGTKVMGADGKIPADAHRISFGADRTNIHLQYKKYTDGKWQYFLVPELKSDVAGGTVVNFVSGGRTVSVYGGSTPPEVYTDIVTLYDLLNGIRTLSAILDVTTPVANDRDPAGQAAHELQTRTDAHAEPSSGTGSDSARGFENVTVASGAGTQLVIATCRAVSATDHPLASLGRERWELNSSTLGSLGTIVTGEAFPGVEFGLKIPRRLPFEFSGVQKGRFTVTDIRYVGRVEADPDPPPICPQVGENMGALGPAAFDQTLTFVWTKRPSGDCNCVGMPFPNFNTGCLGTDIAGSEPMTYEDDTIARIKALREWETTTVRTNSGVNETNGLANAEPFLSAPTQDITGPRKSLKAIVDDFERTLALIDPLEGGTPSFRGAGCLAWDDAFSELQDDIGDFTSEPTTTLLSLPSYRYDARLGAVLIAAGLSPLGESDASILQSGDGCWRDTGDAYYFSLVGSAGAYAPVFVNTPYYAARRASGDGLYYATHEFALQINVKPECVVDLREGDQISAVIGNAAQPSTYQIGDRLIVPIIGAQNLYLAGGQNASLVQTWNVNGSVSGPLPSFSYDPNSPSIYDSGTLSFTLTPGGIDFANADRFTFSIEGGHYRWRKNGGAWNVDTPPLAIPASPVAFDAGLSVEFVPGAAPSFVPGDVYSFLALQPWAASNLQSPSVEPWKWAGGTASMVADCGEVVDADITAMVHTLPEGATITIEGGTAPGVYDWSEPMTWREDLIAHLFSAVRTFRYLRLTVGDVTPADATGGAVEWWAAGMAFQTRRSANVTPKRTYAMAEGDGGLYGRRVFLGKGKGAEVVWPESELSEDNRVQLEAMLDHVKQNNDEPLVFLSQVTRPGEAMFVRVAEDEIPIHDTHDGNKDAAIDRDFDARLTLAPVLR
ncbi:MAG: hypothetical protein ABI831_06865 [Betaproteobacteria bacterium]